MNGATDKSLTMPDGARIAYRDFGSAGASPPIMLVHGLGASGLQFAADAAYFAGLGFRVIVPDIRGHGDSGAPEHATPGAFAVETLAADLIAVLDDAGVERVHWVGNSLGGIVGLSLLASAPQRFSSFAMFGTAPSLSLPRATAAAIPLLYKLLGRRRLAQVTALTTTHDAEGRRVIARMLEAFDPEVGRAIARHVQSYDLGAAALAHAGPMLVLRCGRDHAVNRALAPWLQRLAARTNISFAELPEGGHCANLDATTGWRSALVKFWQHASSG
jgi:3-oxoadipate enol-lactonase